ncbi:MAG TPA: L-2-hydroxyglutarate oxidase [Candidatus Nanopelagicaceae bacterium]
MASEKIAVIGAGIIGLAVARRLNEVQPGSEISVIDKEPAVGAHQTSHNSGVVHAGVYYAPNSLKATLCRRGSMLLREYCAEKNIAYDECGKLVIASNNSEIEALLHIQERAERNGVEGIRRVGTQEIREIEPHARGVAGLYSPKTAITDYAAVARALAGDVVATGGRLLLGKPATSITSRPNGVAVRVGDEELLFDRVVICAGLQSDSVAKEAGDDAEPAIVPFRGEYYRLVPAKKDLVKGLIYPVPDPNYPFLGVHFTRRVDGSVDVGPNAVLAFAREGYRRRDFSPRDMWETWRWSGFQRLARKHWKMGVSEMVGSISKHQFLDRARVYVPELQDVDVVRGSPGVRAQAVDRDGTLVDDFRIHRLGKILAVRNAPSPGATSSLAIAEYICDELLKNEN